MLRAQAGLKEHKSTNWCYGEIRMIASCINIPCHDFSQLLNAFKLPHHEFSVSYWHWLGFSLFRFLLASFELCSQFIRRRLPRYLGLICRLRVLLLVFFFRHPLFCVLQGSKVASPKTRDVFLSRGRSTTVHLDQNVWDSFQAEQ